jgi:GntR family transcriptional regulator, trigonelline degradation regulator
MSQSPATDMREAPIRTAGTSALRTLRLAILEGVLKPGDHLKEKDIAQELEISRTPVREAIRVLQAEGLVEVVPNRGAFVRSYDTDELVDLHELRALLESHSVRLAAGRITAADLRALTESCARMARSSEADDVHGFTTENEFFHRRIAEATRSQPLGAMIRQVTDLLRLYRTSNSIAQRELSTVMHRRIVKALRARDADAAEQLMADHILENLRVLEREFAAQSSSGRLGLRAILEREGGVGEGRQRA